MELVGLHDVPLGRLVAVAGNLANRRWSQYLGHHGLTPAGMSVMMTLHAHGELTHRETASHCFIRPATLTGIVDTLEKTGHVKRLRTGDDRRTVRLALTQTGAERITQIVKLVHAGQPLTSVDADPAKAAVIREFLLELIGNISEGEEISDTSG